MSELTQAMEVVKDLSQMKARLMKDQIELRSIMDRSKENPLTSITWGRIQEILDGLDTLISALDSFTHSQKGIEYGTH